MVSSKVVIVSADGQTQQTLAKLMAKRGLVPIQASTTREAEDILNQEAISLILCSDDMPDGGFGDIVGQTTRTPNRVPVVVVSRLADWERYFNVLRTGAFDLVLYPPIRGELDRVVANALSYGRRERAQQVSAAA